MLTSSLLIVVVVIVVAIWTYGAVHRDPTTTGQTPDTTTSSLSTVPLTVPPTVPPQQPQLEAAITSLLEHRQGTVEVAVQNVVTGATWTFGSDKPQSEASVVKVNILVALLARSTSTNQLLDARQDDLARQMIELSDNDAATVLWNIAGGSVGIGSFNKAIGLSSTTLSPCVQCPGFPWPGWGLSTTSPLDLLKLLRNIFVSSAKLTPSSQQYVRQLMETVVPSERWGITGGVPGNVTVALKNGWVPLNLTDTDWQINSVGWVHGNGRDYIAALLSTGNPSEAYGIQTLDAVSSLLWTSFAP
jgi:hypothetical protein